MISLSKSQDSSLDALPLALRGRTSSRCAASEVHSIPAASQLALRLRRIAATQCICQTNNPARAICALLRPPRKSRNPSPRRASLCHTYRSSRFWSTPFSSRAVALRGLCALTLCERTVVLAVSTWGNHVEDVGLGSVGGHGKGGALVGKALGRNRASLPLQEGGSYAGALGKDSETALRCTECPSEPSNPTGQMTRTMAPMPL